MAEKTERYHKIASFVDALFSRIDEFAKPPCHPKWKEASVSAVIPGWQRFKPAQDWIDRWRAQRLDVANQTSLSRFKDFMAQQGHANLSQEELEKVVLTVPGMEWPREELRPRRREVLRADKSVAP